jgi:VCBS repeat-containing protein
VSKKTGAAIGTQLSLVGSDDVDRTYYLSHYKEDGDSEYHDYYTFKGDIAGPDTLFVRELSGEWAGYEGVEYSAVNHADITMYLGVGRDEVFGRAGNDYIFGGEGDDRIWGDGYSTHADQHNVLLGEDGDDYLFGSYGMDTIVGGEDNDVLGGKKGDDMLFGDGGNDMLLGGGGHDMMFGGAGDDLIQGDQYEKNFTPNLIGEDYEPIVWQMDFAPEEYPNHFSSNAGGNVDTEAGDDLLFGGAGNDILIGNAGNDELWGEDDHDWLVGGLGNDVLYGGAGNDSLEDTYYDYYLKAWRVEDGDDRFYGGSGNDHLDGGKGDDYLNGGQDNDILVGGDGNDNLWGGTGSDTLYGRGGDDDLDGGSGDDRLNGGAGADELYGGVGNDYLEGGRGDDLLAGGIGNDVYYFEPGFGTDRVICNSEGGTGDLIQFGLSIMPNDIRARRLGMDSDDLVLEVGSDVLTVFNYFRETTARPLIQFERDSTTLTYERIEAAVRVGDDSGESLFGTSLNDELVGGNQSDHLDGGTGDDTLDGGLGDDGYFFSRGDGHDIVADTGGETDRLRFESGITLDDLMFRVDEETQNLSIGIRSPAHPDASFEELGDVVVLTNWFNTDDRIEHVEFAENGEILQVDAILAALVSEDDDVLRALEEGSSLAGGAGDDVLLGSPGDDSYLFDRGDGRDCILEAGGHDRLLFGDDILPEDLIVRPQGDDVVLALKDEGVPFDELADVITLRNFFTPENKVEEYVFTDGQVLSYEDISGLFFTDVDDVATFSGSMPRIIDAKGGDDTVVAGSGADQIKGGEGDDLLNGGRGDDTYVFSRGDGRDVIADSDPADSMSDGGSDRIFFLDGIGRDDLIFAWGGKLSGYYQDGVFVGSETVAGAEYEDHDNDLVIGLREGDLPVEELSDRILVKDWFNNRNMIETIIFESEQDMSTQEIMESLFVGEDTYVLTGRNSAPGDDQANQEIIADGGSIEKVRFLNDIAREDIVFTSDGPDLILRYGLELQHQLRITNNWVQRFETRDGSYISRDEVMASLDAIADLAGHSVTDAESIHQNLELKSLQYNAWHDQFVEYHGHDDGNTFVGSADNEIVYGGAGSDDLSGHSGNDTLAPGVGDDILLGGNGNDTYLFEQQDRNDIVYDTEGPYTSYCDDDYGWGLFANGCGDDAPNNDSLVLQGDILKADLEAYWAAPREDLGWFTDDLILRINPGDGSDSWNNREVNISTIINYYASRPAQRWQYNRQGNTYELIDLEDRDWILDSEVFNSFSDKAIKYLAYLLEHGKHGRGDTFSNPGVCYTGDLDEVMSFLERQTASSNYHREYRSEEDTITLSKFYDPAYTIENIVIEGENNTLTNNDLMDMMSSDQAENIRGVDWADNTIDALAGNDWVAGGAQNDTITAGEGSDFIHGRKGDDTYYFDCNDGRDILKEGAEELFGNWAYRAWRGRDTYSYFTANTSFDNSPSFVANPDGGGNDQVVFGADLNIRDISFVSYNDDRELYVGYGELIAADDSTDQTTRDFGDASGFGFVNGFGSGANTTGQMVYADDILLPYQYYQSGGAIEEFTLSDGSSISNEAIVHGLAESRAYIAANEVYLAQIQADGRDAKGYVDQIILAKWHRQSRDILCSDADDAIVVGDGDDLVDAAGGNDTIAGGYGADVLRGGTGDDSYIYNRWDGSDTILDAYGNDTILFGAGIRPSDLIGMWDNANKQLVLGIIDEVEKLKAESEGLPYAPDPSNLKQNIIIQGWANPDNQIETFRFSDGATWSSQHLLDTLGVVFNDPPVVSGPVILNDMLEDGSCVIAAEDLLANASDDDGDPLAVEDLLVSTGALEALEQGRWRYLPDADYHGLVEFSYQVTDGTDGVSAAAGLTVMSVNDTPVAPENEIHEVLGELTIEGTLGAHDVDGDTLAFNLPTGPQHGTLTIGDNGHWVYNAEEGYCGNDQAIVTVEDGQGGTAQTVLDFTINVFSGGNVIVDRNAPSGLRLEGIRRQDLTFVGQGDDLRIEISNSGSLLLKEFFADAQNNLEWLETSDGKLNLATDTIVNAGTSGIDFFGTWCWGDNNLNDLLRGSQRADRLFGFGQNDVLFGFAGNDLLSGSHGSDTLVGGDGDDRLIGGRGDDHLFGGQGNDGLSGNRGDDFLGGGTGDDDLNGGDGRDELYGGIGDDDLFGGSENDLLAGGQGDDHLRGGAGDDIYIFNQGDGHDLLRDDVQGGWGWLWQGDGGHDTARFGNGIDIEDISLYMRRGTLQIQYGDDDILEIRQQNHPKRGIERIELEDGSYLTDADVNQLIQQMAAFAVDEGIAMNSLDDVRKNQELMTMVAGAWHQ